ncbi:MAG: Metallo-beta-lactamase superfamily protein [Firmicutes bacterium]|nr:Metallo-beta-lactamase superfamily protein [Bacillota bacterium]
MESIIPFEFGISRLYVVRGCEGTIVIDTGSDTELPVYREAFENFSIKPEEIKLIVITHGHSDHFAGIAAVKDFAGAPVLCHKNAAKALATGINPEFVPRNEQGEAMLKLIAGTVPVVSKPVTADIFIDDEYDLTKFGIAGKIVPTPGHSECSLSVVLESGAAIVGDILIPSPFSGELCLALLATNEVELYMSLVKLLDCADVFYGGHGGPYSKEEVKRLLD